ncbi:MAG: MFS transporter [Anaerolineales bacterium]
MKRTARWYDAITINVFWLGLSTISQSMLPLILPLLVQRFIGETQKATYFGVLRLWGLMVALLAQALMGLISDRSRSRWGRRRPFILLGTLGDLLILAAFAALARSSGFEGLEGFWLLFVLYVFLQFFSNMAQGAAQGLIPDLVPRGAQGRFSAFKSLFEVPLPVILITFTVSPLISRGNMLHGLLVVGALLLASALLTMLSPEQPQRRPPQPIDWQPFLRLLLMTGVFTAIILGMRESVLVMGRLLRPVTALSWRIGGMATAGLLAMLFAIGAGVWVGVRISIGAEKAIRHTGFTWWVINRLAFLVGAFNLSGFILYFIQARLGYTELTAAEPTSRLMMVVGVTLLLAAVPSGWLSDRFGRKRVVAVSGVVAAGGVALLLASTRLVTFYVGGSLIGLATGTFYTANWALGTSLVPEKEAGRYLGLSNLAGAGAGAVGAYISGPIADYFTLHVPQIPGLGYVVIFAVYGLLFLLSALALLGVHPPHVSERSADVEVGAPPIERAGAEI